MSRIYFRQFYTFTVEYYLRAVIRKYSKDVPKKWYKFTTYWINRLSDEDREFIEFVFSRMSPTTNYGLADFPSSESFEEKQTRLYKLEQKFAVDAELISEPQATYLPY